MNKRVIMAKRKLKFNVCLLLDIHIIRDMYDYYVI